MRAAMGGPEPRVLRMKLACKDQIQFALELAPKMRSKVFVPIADPPAVGDHVKLHIRFADGEVHVKGTAEVLKVVSSPSVGVHARFVSLDPDSFQFPLVRQTLAPASRGDEGQPTTGEAYVPPFSATGEFPAIAPPAGAPAQAPTPGPLPPARSSAPAPRPSGPSAGPSPLPPLPPARPSAPASAVPLPAPPPMPPARSSAPSLPVPLPATRPSAPAAVPLPPPAGVAAPGATAAVPLPGASGASPSAFSALTSFDEVTRPAAVAPSASDEVTRPAAARPSAPTAPPGAKAQPGALPSALAPRPRT